MVKQYFLGFRRNDRKIFMRRKRLAERLKLSVRTLDRYLHHLAETGWMETTKRTPRTAFRSVKVSAFGGSVGESIGGSFGGSQKRKNPSKESFEVGAHKQHHQPDDVAAACPDASGGELDLLVLAGVRRNSANVAYIRATVQKGIPIGLIRGAVCLALRRRFQAGNHGRVNSMKYFAGAIHEIVQVLGVSSDNEYFRFQESQLKREIREHKKRGAA